jgi:hypothetical protein
MKQVKRFACFWGFITLVIFLASCSQQATTPELEAQTNSWQKLGGALDFTVEKTPYTTDILLDRTEKPVVASTEDDKKGGRKLVLQRWTGSMWQDFAPPLTVPMNGYPFLDFQIDLQNRPVVLVSAGSKARGNPAFEDSVVYRYENNSWKRLGEPFDFNVYGRNALVVANNGNIYALFNDYTNDKSFIRRWNGATWQTEYTFQKITTTDYGGKPLFGGPIAHGASSLRFTKTNKPVVTWVLTTDEWGFASTAPAQIEIWNSSSWQEGGETLGKSILDKNDQFLNADIPAQSSSSVMCGMNLWQGSTLLPKIKDVTTSSDVALAVDSSNRPIVAHTIRCTPDTQGFAVDAEVAKQDLVVRRWTGSSWQTLGGVVDRIAGRGANSKAIFVDSKDMVYVLFEQCAITSTTFCTNYNLYLSKYIP